MRKSNPLFVDSTKLTSDSVGCTLELMNLKLNEGESLYVKITDQEGNEESTSLKSNGDKKFSGQIWLKHQQEIYIQFFVMGSQGILKQSKQYSDKATYVMQFEWIEEIKNQQIMKNSLKSQKPAPSQKQIMDGFSELSSLIDKWGL